MGGVRWYRMEIDSRLREVADRDKKDKVLAAVIMKLRFRNVKGENTTAGPWPFSVTISKR